MAFGGYSHPICGGSASQRASITTSLKQNTVPNMILLPGEQRETTSLAAYFWAPLVTIQGSRFYSEQQSSLFANRTYLSNLYEL